MEWKIQKTVPVAREFLLYFGIPPQNYWAFEFNSLTYHVPILEMYGIIPMILAGDSKLIRYAMENLKSGSV